MGVFYIPFPPDRAIPGSAEVVFWQGLFIKMPCNRRFTKNLLNHFAVLSRLVGEKTGYLLATPARLFFIRCGSDPDLLVARTLPYPYPFFQFLAWEVVLT